MRWVWLAATLLAAAASGFWAFSTLIGTMMTPREDVYSWVFRALVVIGAALVGGLLFTVNYDATRSRWRFPFLIAVMIVAGGAPHFLLKNARQQEQQTKVDEGRAFEAKFLADLDARRKDVDARIAAKRPFAGQEALSFVQFVSGADLSYRSLGDHSAAALALLKRALDEKIVDPNIMVRGPTRADVADEPLFIQYSKFYIRSGSHGKEPPARVHKKDWAVFKLLVENGADLSLPEAAGVKEDASKTTVPDTVDARYLRLQ